MWNWLRSLFEAIPETVDLPKEEPEMQGNLLVLNGARVKSMERYGGGSTKVSVSGAAVTVVYTGPSPLVIKGHCDRDLVLQGNIVLRCSWVRGDVTQIA